MLINKNNSSIFFILIQKHLLNSKFIFGNFFFLTNNFSLFTNLLFCVNNEFIIDLKNNPFLKIKKNKSNFLKKKNKFKNLICFNKYLFKYKLKFSNLLKIFFFLFKKKKNFNLFTFKIITISPLLITLYKSHFFKNWNFLIGNSISPFYWDLFSNKKLIKKHLNLHFFRNNLYFNKNFKKRKQINFKNNFLFKKILINNFFYLKKKKNNYSYFSFLTKNKPNKNIKQHANWFFLKPYYFLNINEAFKLSHYYPNYLLINLYKNYFKTFTKIRRFKFRIRYRVRMRAKYDFFFKKKFFLSTKLFFFPRNNYIRTNSFFIGKPLFFFSHNYSKFNLINKSPSFKKKTFKMYALSHLSRFSKLLRKNKIMLNVLFSKHIQLKKKTYLRLFNSPRLNRKLKKLNSFIIFKLLTKNTPLFKLNWFKKQLTLINYNENSLNYFTKSILSNFKNLIFKKINKKSSNKRFLFFKIKNKKHLIKFNKKLYKTSALRRKLYYITKEKNSFILNKYSFMLTNNVFNSNVFKNKYFYNIKKLAYSFTYKNEIQKYILKKYTKHGFINNYFNNDFSLSNNLSNLNIFTNTTFFKTNNEGAFFNSFFEKNNETYFILNKKLLYSNKWTYLTNQFNYIKNFIKDDFNFNIKRIRFKPGYMNLWRESRKILQTTLSLKFKYQYKLTKYLSKFNKFIKFKTFLVLEMTLLNILIRTRFFPDESIYSLFLKNNLIFINGYLCNNSHIQLFIGDFIQLIINIKYYILYKWLLNVSLKKKNRLKQVIRKKLNVTFDLEEKKKNNNLPKWVLFNKNLINDVPKYIEVDYFTLSAFILYEPFLWTDINSYNLINYKFGIINLYNWKYIT